MNENLSLLLDKYEPFIDEISAKYTYPDNIKHLLYLIVPAFVLKYGYQKENFIIECFRNIPIFITGKEDPITQAYYASFPRLTDHGYETTKHIYLNRYDHIPLMQLIDNLVHEMNHAINAYRNEISFDETYLWLRTGLTKVVYQKEDLKPLKKEDNYILEEIINTRQTEEIIHIMASFSLEEITDRNLQNTLYAIKNSIDGKYTSDAYQLHTFATRTLLENKTFLSTLENLRINGEIEEIPTWFNQIYGNEQGYTTLIELLTKLTDLAEKEQANKGWAYLRHKRLKETVLELMKLGNRFNENCTFK